MVTARTARHKLTGTPPSGLYHIGRLPLSHTFEGVAGLDHHAIGLELLRAAPGRRTRCVR
ncbi:hypothetical protein ACFYWU_17505 [Streptomyces chrestomyceticus]|uniref:hypothetical protein n=1 Tax=Streptomyces chrestomyceticus TaxID=68185 RepID=UPI0036C2D7AF